MRSKIMMLTGAIALMPTLAHAYIGPGLGAGVIATVLGVAAAIFMMFVALLWYPLKRLIWRNAGVGKDKARSR